MNHDCSVRQWQCAHKNQKDEDCPHNEELKEAEIKQGRCVPVVRRRGELEPLDPVDHIECVLQPIENIVEHGTLEHAHDAEVVFFTHPDHKLLILGHVASASIGPVRRNPRRSEVWVYTPEKGTCD